MFFLENPWTNDLEKAKILANSEHKMILLNFSGSDWCIPCIKMKKDIFENQTFKEGLAQKLILMNADFPRLKKNRLAKDDIIKNEALAEKYNQDGKFPFTLLLNEKGEVIKSWEATNANDFMGELKPLISK